MSGEPTLSEIFDDLRKAMAPVFEGQRAQWALHGPAAEARLADLGVIVNQSGGNCPVQIDGSVDGQRFYFRARHDGWQWHVAQDDDSIFDAPTVYVEGDYDGAGWMPLHVAMGIVADQVEAMRSAI